MSDAETADLSTAGFEVFHAPSFGDEDFQLLTTLKPNVAGPYDIAGARTLLRSSSPSMSRCVPGDGYVDVRSPFADHPLGGIYGGGGGGGGSCCLVDGEPQTLMHFDDELSVYPQLKYPSIDDFRCVQRMRYRNDDHLVAGRDCAIRSPPTSCYAPPPPRYVDGSDRTFGSSSFAVENQLTSSSVHCDRVPPVGYPVSEFNSCVAAAYESRGDNNVCSSSDVMCQRTTMYPGAQQQYQVQHYTTSCNTPTKRTRPVKKRKRKDTNEPQKPVSAYALFFRDTQAAIKCQNPSASFGEMSKIVAAMWDTLDDLHKNVYRKRTEVAKKLYLKQLATYRASLLTKTSPDEPDVSSPQQPSVSSPTTTTSVVAAQMAPPPATTQTSVVGRQASYSPAMTSPQHPQMTSQCARYDVYGTIGNNNNHLVHRSPTTPMSVRLYPGMAVSQMPGCGQGTCVHPRDGSTYCGLDQRCDVVLTHDVSSSSSSAAATAAAAWNNGPHLGRLGSFTN